MRLRHAQLYRGVPRTRDPTKPGLSHKAAGDPLLAPEARLCHRADSPRERLPVEAVQERRIGIVATSAQFVFALLGADYDGSPYSQTGERIARLAVSGIRLVIDEFRTDVTKTRKDGSRGKLRIDYGDRNEPEKPIAWLLRFLDGAKTAGELYGRALVVIAAEQYASRLVVPISQRTHPTCWASHKDLAGKALKKLVTPHLPASFKQLRDAVEKSHRDYTNAERTAIEQTQRTNAQLDEDSEAEHIEAELDELDEPEPPATFDEGEPTDDASAA
jgi:hypothetical protein